MTKRPDRFPVAWAIPDDDNPGAEDRMVVDLTDATCVDEAGVRCPACGNTELSAVETQDGGHYHHCPTCSRLWVGDGRLRLVLDAVVARRG